MTLYDLISPGGVNPAWWNCPIQQGVPILLTIIYRLLIFGAGIGFFIGILTAVFYYLTAYGDETRAKKGKDALRWTIIGSLIFMFSYIAIYYVTAAFLDKSERAVLNVIGDNSFILRGFDTEGNLLQFGAGASSVCGDTPQNQDTTQNSSTTPNKTTTKPGTANTTKIDSESEIFSGFTD